MKLDDASSLQPCTWAESPLEELFWANTKRYLAEGVVPHAQVEVATQWGAFRLDFLFEVEGRKVAVECDGKDFHNARRDEWRDALIMDAGGADEIVRFRGCNLTYSLEDCLAILRFWEPGLFSPRGLAQLEVLASDGVRRWRAGDGLKREAFAIIPYSETTAARVERRCPLRDKDPFWKMLVARAKEIGPTASLDALLDKSDATPWKKAWERTRGEDRGRWVAHPAWPSLAAA